MQFTPQQRIEFLIDSWNAAPFVPENEEWRRDILHRIDAFASNI